MLIIAGSMTFAAADREVVLAGLAEVTAASRRDTGCVEYWWAEDLDEPNTFRFYECWESKEMLDAHLAQPHETAFGENMLPLMTGATASMFEAAFAAG
jgi:quinol monooxygenase YgiN